MIQVLEKEVSLDLLMRSYHKAIKLLENRSERATSLTILQQTLGILWNLSIERESVMHFALRVNLIPDLLNFLDESKFSSELSATSGRV